MPEAAVVLGLGANALGSLRALARAGYRVYGVDRDAAKPGARSRFGEKVISADAGDIFDAYRRGLGIIAAREPGRRPVVVPSNDEAVELLDAEREELSRHFRPCVPPPGVVERLTDKWLFDRSGREAGLETPRTWLLSEPEGVPDGELMLKPRRRYGRSGTRLEPPTLVTGRAGLERVSAGLLGEPDEYVVQEMVPGDDDRVEFYGACWREGAPFVEFTGAKIRQYPRRSGSTACARLTESETVRDLSRRLLGSLSYEGCCDVEFKRAPDGTHRLIEVNARPALWHLLGELAGVSLPVSACLAAEGAAPPRLPRPRVGKRWVYLEREIRAIRDRRRAGDAAWTELIGGLLRTRRFAVLSLSDPRPFLSGAGRLLRGRLRRLAHRHSAGAGGTP